MNVPVNKTRIFFVIVMTFILSYGFADAYNSIDGVIISGLTDNGRYIGLVTWELIILSAGFGFLFGQVAYLLYNYIDKVWPKYE